MFIGYSQGAVVPFEAHYGLKRIVVTDSGVVMVRGEVDDGGWWRVTADTYDQGPEGVSIDELRRRVAEVRSAIAASGLPEDNITALATAIVGLDSAGWEDFNAAEFHKGVTGLSSHVLEDIVDGTTTVYTADGTRMTGVMLGPARRVSQ